MSTSESGVSAEAQASSGTEPKGKAVSRRSESILDKFLGLLSSVRFGVTMLVILLICCMIGMLIMQVEVEGFQEYYQSLTPAQRLIYGKLGFFEIYHSWYFNLLLAITGLNIILASIDRFPTAWQYIAKPKLKASPNFIRAQMFNREAESSEAPANLAESVRAIWRKRGFRGRISEENGRITVFAQRNAWNRLGAYVVHAALLT
ncbi:MAG TPA: cytochrome c biogenesis protein ResB, partial [Blastocatellia bacterium]|nr:cytochrome c biogenesis protein ResB [Blastocatellia bacterium]